MWFALLGPFTVHDGEAPVSVPKGPQQRALLASLALRAGTWVPPGTLAGLLWDGAPPDGAAVTLRSHVLRLRRALGPRAGALLVTGHPGYQLQAGDDAVDVLRFRRLCRDGAAAARAGDWERARALLEAAEALWRGEFLDGRGPESLRREAEDLESLRLDAGERLTDAALRLGRHAETVPRLQAMAAAQPLRENVHAQLMLALALGGRQAEALAAYRQARQVIVAELGVEPGPALREVHRRVLSGEALLDGPVPVTPAAPGPPPAVPRELPPAVPGFTGRARELAALTRILDGTGQPGAAAVSVISGTAGVGKTALALHFAHQVAGRFPDGQLYAGLRGFDPAGPPAAPAEVTRGLLAALGVPPEQVPADPDARAGRYRSLLADRRMLIVLDNARDEEQVRPLLPASPGSLVLVTSRSRLTGLAASSGAALAGLEVPGHVEAVALLAARLGPGRAAAEPGPASEIAELCARLPLALAVTAARAAARPGVSLASLAAELAGEAGPLEALDPGDPALSVAAVFSWSYRHLSPEEARMFRLLGVHPGPDISVPAAASLAGAGLDGARRLLSGLARQCLISERAPGRYAFHDLLRAYAAGEARVGLTPAELDAAVSRVLDYYLHSARNCWMRVAPSGERLPLPPPDPCVRPERPAGHRQALAWFAAEDQVLLAAQAMAAETGALRHAWQLANAVSGYLYRRGDRQERAAILASALDAAERLGDVLGQAVSSRRLGIACTDSGGYDEALGHFDRSLALYRELGDRRGEAMVLQNMAILATTQSHWADAAARSEDELRLVRALGDAYLEAEALNDIAYALAQLGRYEEARGPCEQSLAIIAGLGGCEYEDNVWDTYGYILHHLGDYAGAAGAFGRALEICREHGRRLMEPEALMHLGDLHLDIGEVGLARQAWQEALVIGEETCHPLAPEIRGKLAGIAGR